jgi:WD40 repeat protein
MRAPSAVRIMHGSDSALFWAEALSPDGGTLAVADLFGRILFFDARTYEQVGDPITSSWVESIAYSPDGATLAFGGHTWLRWSTRARTSPSPRAGVGPPRAHAVHAGRAPARRPGRALDRGAGWAHAGAANRLDRAGGVPAGVPPVVLALAARRTDADGSSALTASDAGELAWWDLQSGRKVRTLPIASGYHALALSPDGARVAVGIDGGLQFVDVASGSVRSVRAGISGTPNWAVFSPDGATVVTANEDGTVTVWDAAAGAVRDTLRGHSNDAAQAVFSPDGKTLYTASNDGTAVAWDVAAIAA